MIVGPARAPAGAVAFSLLGFLNACGQPEFRLVTTTRISDVAHLKRVLGMSPSGGKIHLAKGLGLESLNAFWIFFH